MPAATRLDIRSHDKGEQAEAAIADAWTLAQEFRNLADAIELQAEQTGEWMEDAQ